MGMMITEMHMNLFDNLISDNPETKDAETQNNRGGGYYLGISYGGSNIK